MLSFCQKLKGIMIWLMISALLIVPLLIKAQKDAWRTKIDQAITIADSLSLKSQRNFHLPHFLPDGRCVRENWYYTVQDNQVIIFEVRYIVDSLEFIETYYVDRDKILC